LDPGLASGALGSGVRLFAWLGALNRDYWEVADDTPDLGDSASRRGIVQVLPLGPDHEVRADLDLVSVHRPPRNGQIWPSLGGHRPNCLQLAPCARFGPTGLWAQ